MTLTTTRLDYAAARKAMLDSQLRTSGVNDVFVLERMGTVAREDFVPQAAKATAYMDRAIRLESGGFLPAPLFHGAMLAEARPTMDDSVLVIDGGSGYLPALVEPLVAKLDTVTPDKAANGAKRGAYTLVLVDGAIEHVPAALAKLVADGGRIVTGMVERGVTRLATGRKSGKALALLPLAEMGIPRLGAFDRPQSWSF
ncbi:MULTISPECIES: protein-L-isoaspartate O-methyltransferase family protein [Erythrobacter]|uniref:protein-L-isoaspartate O-methyltransferase family protein n=1 Tax=Erythrobacter TaxID=1041 RepID=UPI000C698643|nr:protein-L-isoaspartate O-methyltransferase [Erythrobacter sp. SN021]MBQ94435.1 protein-L-isoaspartate O-methyltransferase [Actinomycetota bacterium]MCF8882984.1 protein-L-isoaspartate O-methyltransferase [Erythrobacter sp. SN021]|tara:strand:+ start:371 stop:967 length:597 start_codon:yes stop_codon:yes gene_type:complete